MTSPLSDSEYEQNFMQLLEGVHQGWEVSQVERFLTQLLGLAPVDAWVAWLRRFGDRVQKSAVQPGVGAAVAAFE